ncbi:MAG: AAA family ATPase [Bdellovibrionales bacterium]|nr:AAA family ATPase [Bdellovibrionales bacterium]
MSHARPRLILDLLKRRLKHSPIVAIQGARQTGKSFLARQLSDEELTGSKIVSLDSTANQVLAQDTPQTFLKRFEDVKTLIIDEAQKAPALFNEMKYVVDQNRRPGRYLLLGSTEFSHLQRIRESLTGRMGRVRLFPMVSAELLGQKKPAKTGLSRGFVLKYSESGGMPGIAFVRDDQARSDLLQDWLDLTCNRDIHQFKTLRLDSDLAYSIFKECCLQNEPTQASIAKALRKDGRRVATHLKVFCELFALVKLDPHPSGHGKSIYLPMDAGLAFHLGANLERRLHIILMNERMAKNTYFGKKRNRYFYYRSTGKRMIHLIEEDLDKGLIAFELSTKERIKLPELELLKAFKKKNPKTKTVFLAPIEGGWKEGVVQIQPWESLVSF